MSTTFLTVEEAAQDKEEFFQNVKTEIIPRLIAKKLLAGKMQDGVQLVSDDDALARMKRLGVEAFVYNQQGYSFVVVHAAIDQVAEVLNQRPGVVTYEQSVKPQKMKKDVAMEADEEVRHTFLLQMRDTPEWSVLVQTVHWFHSCDAIMGTALAAMLSEKLQILAAAAWDDDFSGSSLIICEQGNQKAALSDSDGWEDFYEFFYEHGISLPELFIGVDKGIATLFADEPAKIQRADYLVLKVPSPIESRGPHVFEKLAMMAEGMAEELDDEEAFMKHMQGGIWDQAQAMLSAGEL